MNFADRLRRLIANGYRPLPIIPGEKAPGLLQGDHWRPMPRWSRHADAPISDGIVETWIGWAKRGGEPGLGVACGAPAGDGWLAAIDADCLHPDLADEAADLFDADAAPVRYGRRPKRLVLIRCTERIEKLRSAAFRLGGVDNTVEVLGWGQQFVAFGTHPDTGGAYEWENGSPLEAAAADLPVWTPAQLHERIEAWQTRAEMLHGAEQTGRGRLLHEEREPKAESDLVAPLGQVRSAVDAIPNDDLHYDDWIRVAHAIKSALRHEGDGDAFAVWDAWSAKSEKYQPGETERAWRSIDAASVTTIGRGSLFHTAEQHGWTGRTPEPDAEFDAVAPGEGGDESTGRRHWIDEMNDAYAFAVVGGGHHILWETTDEKRRFKLEHLNETTFHKMHASRMIWIDGAKRPQPLTKLWMESERRRTYRGLCFRPAGDAPDGMYNLWRGFAVDAADATPDEAAAQCGTLLEHLRENVCQGERRLYEWLLNWMAHLVQRPGEKPGVAVVLRGGKGVGKTVVASVLGRLLGSHYMLTANRRFLTSNFNGHMESLLLLALDEAFWSGDKAAEGVLKDLVTGDTHLIEHKGKEPYSVDNLLRVMVLGNEDWLVPASADERRFAVFDVGPGWKQDHEKFGRLWAEMRNGGDAALLTYLRSLKVSRESVHKAPATGALADQKEASLDLAHQWLRDSIEEGRLLDVDDEWLEEVSSERLYNGFGRYCARRGIRSRLPDVRSFGKQIREVFPSIHRRKGGARESRYWVYELPPYNEAVKLWDRFVGRE